MGSSESHRTAEEAEVEEEEELGRGVAAAPLPMRRLTPGERDFPARSSIQTAADRSRDGDTGLVDPNDPCFRSMAVRRMAVRLHGSGSRVSGGSDVGEERRQPQASVPLVQAHMGRESRRRSVREVAVGRPSSVWVRVARIHDKDEDSTWAVRKPVAAVASTSNPIPGE